MTSTSPASVLIVSADGAALAAALAASALGPFVPRCVPAWAPGMELEAPAAVIVDAAMAGPVLAAAGGGRAVLVRCAAPSAAEVVDWIDRGAQDVAGPEAPDWPLRLRAAIERRRLLDEIRRAVGIDLGTGLPDQQQLGEHMSHLLALRAREPAPVAVLVLRIEGLATVQARLGREAAQVLRRKLAVRLRAGVRASDVVASIGEDRFAILLSRLLLPSDADTVATKLRDALLAPVPVAGQPVAVAVAVGIAQAGVDGDQPELLLASAARRAAGGAAQGRGGHANFEEAGRGAAANEE
jgi:diguanylate cyclase (GGDEF)-like protein